MTLETVFAIGCFLIAGLGIGFAYYGEWRDNQTK